MSISFVLPNRGVLQNGPRHELGVLFAVAGRQRRRRQKNKKRSENVSRRNEITTRDRLNLSHIRVGPPHLNDRSKDRPSLRRSHDRRHGIIHRICGTEKVPLCDLVSSHGCARRAASSVPLDHEFIAANHARCPNTLSLAMCTNCMFEFVRYARNSRKRNTKKIHEK